MFEREIRLYEFARGYCHRLMEDIADGEMTAQPAPNVNTPLWILGHLAVATDFAAGLLGQRRACPEAWHQAFGRGSSPQVELTPPPTKAELLAAIDLGQRHVINAVQKTEPEELEMPHNVELFRATPLRSVGDLLGHLMTTHPALHLGQLSLWRRLQGRAPLF